MYWGSNTTNVLYYTSFLLFEKYAHCPYLHVFSTLVATMKPKGIHCFKSVDTFPIYMFFNALAATMKPKGIH